MIIYFIILFILLLFTFKIRKKKIKNDIIESPIKPIIKKKNNVIEYFTNPEDQQCLRHSRKFNKNLNKSFKTIIENNYKKQPNGEVHKGIKVFYQDMIDSCKKYENNCKIHDFTQLCRGLDHKNNNNCELLDKRQKINGSYLVKYRKIETDTWRSLEFTQKDTEFLLSKDKITKDDYNYEKVKPINFIFNYESKFNNNFKDYIIGAKDLSSGKYNLFNFYSVNPGIKFDNIELLSKILKLVYQFRELDIIFTEQDIKDYKKQEGYNKNNENIKMNSSNYIISKLDEINSRVNDMVSQNKLKLIKIELTNQPFPLEIEVEKYLWNYCKFKNKNIELFNQETPRSVQEQINNKDLSISRLKDDCLKADGEFIKVPTLSKNSKNDRYYCIDKNKFSNSNTYYMEGHLDNKGKIINKVDFETDEEFKKAIQKSNKKIKNGIRSCDRIFDLQYDYLAKECSKKFNDNGCLGSTFNPSTKEYDVSMCINSNIKINETNEVENADEIKNKFYIINPDGIFVETLKKKFNLDYLDDDKTTSKESYYDSLTECSGSKTKKIDGSPCEPEYPPDEFIGTKYNVGFEKEDKNGNKYIIKQKIVKIDMENVKKLYWEKK
jgi:hypothetical protein